MLLGNCPKQAWLYVSCYEALTASIGFRAWHRQRHPNGREFITTNRDNQRGSTTLSRFIVQAGPGEIVSIIDGDPYNLRTTNLEVVRLGKHPSWPSNWSSRLRPHDLRRTNLITA